MSRLSLFEQETTITFDNATKTANIFTYDKKLIRRIREHADRNDMRIIYDYEDHLICEIPKKWIKINPSRILSEEEKERKRAQALKNLR